MEMKSKILALTLIVAATALTVTSIQFSEAKPGALEVEWQRQLPGVSGSSIIQTADGGFLVLGKNASIQVNDFGQKEYVNKTSVLLKTDSAGHVLWEKLYCSKAKALKYRELSRPATEDTRWQEMPSLTPLNQAK